MYWQTERQAWQRTHCGGRASRACGSKIPCVACHVHQQTALCSHDGAWTDSAFFVTCRVLQGHQAKEGKGKRQRGPASNLRERGVRQGSGAGPQQQAGLPAGDRSGAPERPPQQHAPPGCCACCSRGTLHLRACKMMHRLRSAELVPPMSSRTHTARGLSCPPTA